MPCAAIGDLGSEKVTTGFKTADTKSERESADPRIESPWAASLAKGAAEPRDFD
jgi:hypothetical protein